MFSAQPVRVLGSQALSLLSFSHADSHSTVLWPSCSSCMDSSPNRVILDSFKHSFAVNSQKDTFFATVTPVNRTWAVRFGAATLWRWFHDHSYVILVSCPSPQPLVLAYKNNSLDGISKTQEGGPGAATPSLPVITQMQRTRQIYFRLVNTMCYTDYHKLHWSRSWWLQN